MKDKKSFACVFRNWKWLSWFQRKLPLLHSKIYPEKSAPIFSFILRRHAVCTTRRLQISWCPCVCVLTWEGMREVPWHRKSWKEFVYVFQSQSSNYSFKFGKLSNFQKYSRTSLSGNKFSVGVAIEITVHEFEFREFSNFWKKQWILWFWKRNWI